MKHLSDDEITKELKNLGQEFEPKDGQKERVRRKVFQQTPSQNKFKLKNFMPIVATIVFFLSIIGGTFFVMNGQFAGSTDGKSTNKINVTDSWNNIGFEQSQSYKVQTRYMLIFENDSLIIYDDLGVLPQSYDPKFDWDLYENEKENSVFKPGKYGPYKVFKENDLYTIEVSGKNGFIFTLEKFAPRKFIGPDGVEFTTPFYLE